MLTSLSGGQHRRRPPRRREPEITDRAVDDGGSSSLQLAVIAMGLFLLLGLGLNLAVNLVTARAASAAAQRGLQVAQVPGGTETEARQVAARIAGSTGFVTATSVEVSDDEDTVTVEVELTTVLDDSLARTATGPRLRFVPQARR